VLAGLLASSACGSSSSGGKLAGKEAIAGNLTVFAASSLTDTFSQLGKDFEAAHPGTTVRFSYGSSATLAQQIIQGAPADLFASAAPSNMQQVVAAGDIVGPVDIASNRAEVAVAPSAAGRIHSLADLGKPGVKVAECVPTAPCGALAAQVLKNAHVTVTPATQGLDVTTTTSYVTSGQVDAAIVYVTNVLGAGSDVVAVKVPPAVNASTEYPIGVVKTSSRPALARAFEEYVLSAHGQQVLRRAGFSSP
jgi:molybdate transport system substrate-binding protein